MRALLWIFGVLSFVVVPLLTFSLGLHGNPFEDSFSAIGNSEGMRLAFIIWTLALCAYFSAAVFAIVILTRNIRAKAMRRMILIGTWLLLFTNAIPFFPDKYPVLAKLHNYVAMFSVVFLVGTLCILVLTFRRDYPRLFHKSAAAMSCLIVAMITLFSFFRAKWITEATCVIGGSIFLFFVMWWLYKENDFNAEDVLSSYDIEKLELEIQRLDKRTREAYEEYADCNAKLQRAQIELGEIKRRRPRRERKPGGHDSTEA